MENTNETERKTFSALILTPYLSEGIQDADMLEDQMNRFGYNPENLEGEDLVLTDNGSKVLIKSPGYNGWSRNQIDQGGIQRPTLAIAGSTRPGEDEVRGLKGSGIAVARYSIFYGGDSGYTGNSPGETGYALDIPKDLTTVKELLASEDLMNALDSRNFDQVNGALENLNKNLGSPVLATPYLEAILD